MPGGTYHDVWVQVHDGAAFRIGLQHLLHELRFIIGEMPGCFHREPLPPNRNGLGIFPPKLFNRRSLLGGHILQVAATGHEGAFEPMGHQAVEQDTGSLEVAAFRQGYNDLQWLRSKPL